MLLGKTPCLTCGGQTWWSRDRCPSGLYERLLAAYCDPCRGPVLDAIRATRRHRMAKGVAMERYRRAQPENPFVFVGTDSDFVIHPTGGSCP